jgi:hypothetical protein
MLSLLYSKIMKNFQKIDHIFGWIFIDIKDMLKIELTSGKFVIYSRRKAP